MLTRRDEDARLALTLGEYRIYIEPYLEGRLRDPIVACQVALYLGRPNEAEDWLAECERGAERDVIEAEYLIARGDYEGARALLVGKRGLRDRLNLARLAWLRAEWLDCLGWARLALAEAEVAENLFMEGRARHLIGSALYELGETAEGVGEFQRATIALRCSENGRFRRFAETNWAGTMIGTEREGEGLQMIARAHDESLRLGHLADVRIFRSSLTEAAYSAGHYQRAVDHAVVTLGEARHDREPATERYALDQMTRCYLAMRRVEDARDCVDSLALLDGLVRDRDLPMSEALEWRVAGREGNPDAVGELVARAAEAGGWRAVVFRVWAWDVLGDLDPLAAYDRRAELTDAARGHAVASVRAELRAVEDTMRPLRITRAGELVVKLGAFPPPETAAALVEAFEFRLAYEDAKGNATRMAALLGMARRSVSRKLGALGLEPRRRGRPPSAAEERAEPVQSVEE